LPNKVVAKPVPTKCLFHAFETKGKKVRGCHVDETLLLKLGLTRVHLLSRFQELIEVGMELKD